MQVLEYNDLDIKGLEAKYNKVKIAIKNQDFYTAQTKKLKNHSIFSARLDYTNRLLFKFTKYQEETYVLMLEVVRNHDYAGARFLNGSKIIEENIAPSEQEQCLDEIKYINKSDSKFFFLNKVISFDEDQSLVYKKQLPLVIIGSAGSGKTMLSLERMKILNGHILYVSQSSYLVDNARNLYYCQGYNNENQEIDFLSYNEFLESIKTFNNKVFNYPEFRTWYDRYRNTIKFNDPEKLFEEIKGTLTGVSITKPYLSKDQYLDLGVKQSLFLQEEKERIYLLFSKYLEHIKKSNLIDVNILSYEYLNLVESNYDYIVIDEVQDLTNIQIQLILKSLKTKTNFLLCGDSNQIVHPNFFSWSKIKTLFYEEQTTQGKDILFLLTTSYRNSQGIVDIANNTLKIKQQRFGSIDKESNYLVKSVAENKGRIFSFNKKGTEIAKLNKSSMRSTKYAIIVLKEDQKKEAQKYFQSPLVFSIHEAKGLEYDNIIIFNLVSSAYEKFQEIAEGISFEDLEKDLLYSRAKDKTDKSSESYKFYINSFYVAITRAINNLYIIEERTTSRFLELLDVYKYSHTFDSEQDLSSSLEEWQKEASKLEKQGKYEQANKIRSDILEEKEITWDVLTKETSDRLYNKVITDEANKQEKILLFEYSLINNHYDIINLLKSKGLNAAQYPKKSFRVIREKYYTAYMAKNHDSIMEMTRKYGLNFKDQFNQTPIMIAVKVGNDELTKNLIEQGANIEEIDKNGIFPIQNFLSYLFFFGAYTKEISIIELYKLLSTHSIVIRVNDKLHKIDAHKFDYLLYHLLLGILVNYTLKNNDTYFYGFTAAHIASIVANFPDQIIKPYQKKRQYISHILSKNERNSTNIYGQKFLFRLSLGHYMLNPEIAIKHNDSWTKLFDIIKFDLNADNYEFSNKKRIQSLLATI